MTEEVIIVGGGTGGSVLANRLGERLKPGIEAGDVRITLVNDGKYQYYKPAYLYVPFNKKSVEEAKRPIRDLLDSRVEFRNARVDDLDTDSKTVDLDDGENLGYDHLVIATGSNVVPGNVPGLADGGHNFYTPEGAQTLREELADFEEGHLVLSVIGVPHMCPAAPLEFVFMADDWFRKRGLRDDIEITYTYPIMRAHGLEEIAEWAEPRLAKRDINLETFFNVETVDADGQVLETMEGTELEYDLLVGIPPHEGGDLIQNAGLGGDGWMEVDNHTLESEHASDVYGIGDVAEVPTSKAGSVAHYEASTIADRITSRIRGETPTSVYDGKTICFIETGMDEATFVDFDYEYGPTMREPSAPIHWAKLGYNESYWLTARGLL